MLRQLYLSIFMFLCFSPFLFAEADRHTLPGWISSINPPARPGASLKVGHKVRITLKCLKPTLYYTCYCKPSYLVQVNLREQVGGRKEIVQWIGKGDRSNQVKLHVEEKDSLGNIKKAYFEFTVPLFQHGKPNNNQIWLEIEYKTGDSQWYESIHSYTYVR